MFFFVFSYICGLIFQEIGFLFDKLLHFLLYGGNPREKIFEQARNEGADPSCSKESGFHWHFRRLYNAELLPKQIRDVRQLIIEKFDLGEDTEKIDATVYSFCLNFCELNGLSSKIDRMIAFSEMARSLFLGGIASIILNIVLFVNGQISGVFFYTESVFLLIFSLALLVRKVRFEEYRSHIMFRQFLIYMERTE